MLHSIVPVFKLSCQKIIVTSKCCTYVCVLGGERFLLLLMNKVTTPLGSLEYCDFLFDTFSQTFFDSDKMSFSVLFL